MARTETITLSATEYVSLALTVKRDERKVFELTNGSGDMTMTISATDDGDPLVEIPGTTSIDVTPDKISSLAEGRTYKVNLWDMSDGTYPELMATGTLVISSTIAPAAVDYPTQWLDGVDISKVTVLTQTEYDALGTYETDALYVVTA